VRIYTAHPFPGPAWSELGDVVYEHDPAAEVLVVANETVDGALLDTLPKLKLVANYGVGYDRVDVDECARRGIVVTNTPGVLTDATADLTFALILATVRDVVARDRAIRAGNWRRGWSQGRLTDDVTGATLGIVGRGRIGGAVAARAEGFRMRVLSVRSTSAAEELDELLRTSDIVTLHVPLNEQSRRMIDARRLALLRDGATFVNTARGELVDQDALVRELISGRIRAGLDVFTGEPDVPRELFGLDNVVLTPHIGSATVSARHGMTRLVVDNILAFERGEAPLTPVISGGGPRRSP
jgi:glyoxylate reductase